MKTDIELISIGTELLSGRTLNSHAQTLGIALSQIGLRLARDTTIADETETIQSAVREALERVDIVVVSGGLGPTPDDITREALAALFECGIGESEAALVQLERYFEKRGREVTPAAKRQIQVLDGAEVLLNSVGAAPGQMIFPMIGKTLFVVPGPPREFAAILDEHIAPWLCKTFPEATPLELRVLIAQGIGESDIITKLEAARFQCSDVSIGFYPGFGNVEIRMTAPREKRSELESAERELRSLLQGYLPNS